MARATTLLVPALTALALACSGGFETPDLSSGTVEGRLLNANAGAYVYPFGRPDLRADVDGEGRFSMEGVPVETTEMIVIDGPDPADATRRGQIVRGLGVQGADRTVLADLDASSMPLAGTIAVAAQPAGGAAGVAPRCTVVGTDQVDVVASTSGTAVLGPLPQGLFELRVSMAGFQTATGPVQVAAATTIHIVPLQVDQDASVPGCAATGLCRNGLVCNPSDGYCHECLVDADCLATHGTGSTCSSYTCQAALGTMTGRGLCEPCTQDGECADGACVAYGVETFCTRLASAFSCPPGFGAQNVGRGDGDACVPPRGCAAYRIDFGSECFADTDCSPLLLNGRCHGQDLAADPPVPGYCTGACLNIYPTDCTVVPGYACNAGMALPGLCVRSP